MRASSLLLLLSLTGVAGCGTSDDRDQARTVVERFYDAVRDDRGEDACAELSEAAVKQLESQTSQRCPAVVTRLEYLGGPVVDAHVYVSNAKVDLGGGESAFLNRGPDGWRLSAIACKPEEGPPRDFPMECEVEA